MMMDTSTLHLLSLSEQCARGTVADEECMHRVLLWTFLSVSAGPTATMLLTGGCPPIEQLVLAMTTWEGGAALMMDTSLDEELCSIQNIHFCHPHVNLPTTAASARGVAVSVLCQLETSARGDIEAYYERDSDSLMRSYELELLRQAEARYDFASGCVQVHHGRPATGWITGGRAAAPSRPAPQHPRRDVSWTPSSSRSTPQPQHASPERRSKEPPPWW